MYYIACLVVGFIAGAVLMFFVYKNNIAKITKELAVVKATAASVGAAIAK